MMFRGVNVTLSSVNLAPLQVKRMVAKLLLEHGQDNTSGRHQVSLRDIAVSTGTNWEMVHKSLDSLQVDKAIKFERNRIIINKVLLKKLTGGM